MFSKNPTTASLYDNITQTGAGALNIDAARIPLAGENDEYVINTFDDGAKPFGDGAGHKYTSRKITDQYTMQEIHTKERNWSMAMLLYTETVRSGRI